jgi:hypothetical protein
MGSAAMQSGVFPVFVLTAIFAARADFAYRTAIDNPRARRF